MMKALFLICFASVIYLLPVYRPARAEFSAPSCVIITGDFPPSFKYGQSDAVFIGTVIDVTHVEWEDKPDGTWNRYKKVIARLTVDEAFKGVTESEVTFEMEDCPYDFKEGERYLVYSHRRAGGKFGQSSNSFTRPLAEVKEDVEYVRGLKDKKDAGTIQGAVIRNANSFKPRTLLRDGTNKPEEPMPGIKVFIENSQHSFEAVTNEKGLFEINDVPPGTYRIRSTLPANLGIIGRWWEVVVKGHGTFYASLNVVPKGRLSGRVVDSMGAALSGVRVYFFSADGVTEEMLERIKDKEPNSWDVAYLKTDQNGRYELQGLPEGDYIIAVNLINGKDKTEDDYKPGPRAFYPGVFYFSDAKIIPLKEGESMEIADFKIPSPPQQ